MKTTPIFQTNRPIGSGYSMPAFPACFTFSLHRSWVIRWTLICLFSATLCACHSSTPINASIPVKISGRKFVLEPAVTWQEQYQGLSNRASIPDDGGMIFVFSDSDNRTFVMRRCLVPIDLVYLDAKGRVVSTHHMTVEPYATPEWRLKKYASRGPAQFAIELKGGTLERLKLKPGQKVNVPLARLKRAAQ